MKRRLGEAHNILRDMRRELQLKNEEINALRGEISFLRQELNFLQGDVNRANMMIGVLKSRSDLNCRVRCKVV